MKPNKKPETPAARKRAKTVGDQNNETKTNEQIEGGGGYARPRDQDVPGHDRPDRGGS